MYPADVALALTALLDRYAQQRAATLAATAPADAALLTRMLQAEAAGCALLGALVRPDPGPDRSLGASFQQLVGALQTVIRASTPDHALAPLLSVRAQRVTLDADAARLLRATMLRLVLAALDDDAQEIEVRLTRTPLGAALTVESDRPGGAAELLAPCGGSWAARCAPHGGSWIVQASLSSERRSILETRHGR